MCCRVGAAAVQALVLPLPAGRPAASGRLLAWLGWLEEYSSSCCGSELALPWNICCRRRARTL